MFQIQNYQLLECVFFSFWSSWVSRAKGGLEGNSPPMLTNSVCFARWLKEFLMLFQNFSSILSIFSGYHPKNRRPPQNIFAPWIIITFFSHCLFSFLYRRKLFVLITFFFYWSLSLTTYSTLQRYSCISLFSLIEPSYYIHHRQYTIMLRSSYSWLSCQTVSQCRGTQPLWCPGKITY
jgi:hypothetical protein